MVPESTPVTFTTPASNDRSNSPESRLVISAMSIVASNVPETTSGALTVTGAPTVIPLSDQSDDISSDSLSTSNPSDMARTLVSSVTPNTSKLIVTSEPDPLTPVVSGRLNITLIVSGSIKRHMSIGTSVPSMVPESTPVTFTTPASNDRSN